MNSSDLLCSINNRLKTTLSPINQNQTNAKTGDEEPNPIKSQIKTTYELDELLIYSSKEHQKTNPTEIPKAVQF